MTFYPLLSSKKESFLLDYILLDGPFEIANRLKELNISYSLFKDPNGGHEWADLGYQYPEIIVNFLFKNILGKEKIQ